MSIPILKKCAFVASVFILFISPAIADDYAEKRQQLVEIIAQDVRDTAIFIGKKEFDQAVMAAMGKVPRHEFVSLRYRDEAYENQPLPIGYGQTISQPYIVALMTDLASLRPTDKVLEIGTGSGYQAAILAELVDQVYTIEIIDALGKQAEKIFKQLDYTNIRSKISDGYYGWEEYAPFDAIIVTAAASHVPPPLIQQLKPGGRLIIPVGSRFMTQHLVLVIKNKDGDITARQILPVRFVPLTGGHK